MSLGVCEGPWHTGDERCTPPVLGHVRRRHAQTVTLGVWVGIKKHFLRVRAVKHWNKVPEVSGQSPFLAGLETR